MKAGDVTAPSPPRSSISSKIHLPAGRRPDVTMSFWHFMPQHIELVSKNEDLRLGLRSRFEEARNCAPDQPADSKHRAKTLRNSHLLTRWSRFGVGTAIKPIDCNVLIINEATVRQLLIRKG
jgi:hypothetical protein